MEFTRTFNYIHCLNLFRCVINSFYGVNRLNLLLGLSKRYGNETVKTNNFKKISNYLLLIVSQTKFYRNVVKYSVFKDALP